MCDEVHGKVVRRRVHLCMCVLMRERDCHVHVHEYDGDVIWCVRVHVMIMCMSGWRWFLVGWGLGIGHMNHDACPSHGSVRQLGFSPQQLWWASRRQWENFFCQRRGRFLLVNAVGDFVHAMFFFFGQHVFFSFYAWERPRPHGPDGYYHTHPWRLHSKEFRLNE